MRRAILSTTRYTNPLRTTCATRTTTRQNSSTPVCTGWWRRSWCNG